MKYLLPLFLIFSFSAQAIGFSCFQSNSENQPSPAELARGSQINRAIDLLKHELLVNLSIEDILKTLKTLTELGFSKNDINNIFIPTILRSKFGKKIKLQDYIAQGQKIAREDFKIYKLLTPYETLGLLSLHKNMVSNNITPGESIEFLIDLGFSRAEVNSIFIPAMLDPKFDKKGKLKNYIAQGHELAREDFKIDRELTPYQALGLFSLNKDMVSKNNITPGEISEFLIHLGFFKGEISELLSKYKQEKGRELAREDFKIDRELTPDQAFELFYLNRDMASNYITPSEMKKDLQGLGFSEKEINKIIKNIIQPTNT